jgi:hypothetical protein
MDTFIFDINFLSELSAYEKKMRVNGLNQSLFLLDYSVLLSFIFSKDLNSIRHYLLLGHDLNKYSLKGLSILHIVLLLIFHDIQYIEIFEYFLKCGANPNIKTFIFIQNQLKVMNCIELFEYIMDTKDVSPFSFHSIQLVYKELSESDIMKIYLLLYIYETDIYEIHSLNLYHYVKVFDIERIWIENNASLRNYLYTYWKIYINDDNLYDRHLILSTHFESIPYPRVNVLKKGIYINRNFEETNHQISDYEFVEIIENDSSYFFHLDFIPALILSKVNPITNQELSIQQLIQCLFHLESFGNLTYNPLKHSYYPYLFETQLKTKNEIKDKIQYIYEFVKLLNPYSNFLFIKNWKDYEIQFYSFQLYHYNSNFVIVKNINELLYNIIHFIQTDENYIYIINHCYEEVYQDLDNYNKIKKIFNQKNLEFIFDFYEAILILEIFELLMEKFKNFLINEFIFFWEKILYLYSLEFNLNNHTFPLLLTDS